MSAETKFSPRSKRPSRTFSFLGDQPVKHFLAAYDRRWKKLADFGEDGDSYGRLPDVILGSRWLKVLPLAHPRQVSVTREALRLVARVARDVDQGDGGGVVGVLG
jgi:hypothetical protein